MALFEHPSSQQSEMSSCGFLTMILATIGSATMTGGVYIPVF